MGSNQKSLPAPDSEPSNIERFREALISYDKQRSSASLDGVSIALKRVLELDEEAEIYLESNNKSIKGMVTCADSRGKPLAIEILIDDLNGSLIVGKLKVRIESDRLYQKFDKIRRALSILPKERRDAYGTIVPGGDGFAVQSFTTDGDIIATNSESGGGKATLVVFRGNKLELFNHKTEH